MQLIVTIHQPQYLPWIGYFDKISKADCFCFLDNVQFKKNEWQNRNRIKTAQGWQWLTVPVKHRFPQTIEEVEINKTVNWRRKHLQALATNYKKAPFFDEYIEFFEDIYSNEWEFLSELNIYVIDKLCDILNLQTKTVLTSSFIISGDPTDRLINICKALGADTYLSGKDGNNYMDLERFKERGIGVVFQGFQHPVYPQLYGEFESCLSIVDLLFNCGPDSMARVGESNPPLESAA